MAKLNHILPTYVWKGGRCLRRVVFSTEINFNFRNILCNLKEERSVNWVWVVNDIRVVNRMRIRNRVWVGVGADDIAGFDLSNVKCAGIKNWRTFYQRCWTKVFMAAVVLGAQQRKGWEGQRGTIVPGKGNGTGADTGSGTQLKWRNAIYFRIDNRLILLVRVFQLLILRCGSRVALQRGWQVDEAAAERRW